MPIPPQAAVLSQSLNVLIDMCACPSAPEEAAEQSQRTLEPGSCQEEAVGLRPGLLQR